jgi:hypothetical protein
MTEASGRGDGIRRRSELWPERPGGVRRQERK